MIRTWLQKLLFANPRRRVMPRWTAAAETLEHRQLLSAAMVSLSQGVVNIRGTAGNDVAEVQDAGSSIRVVVSTGHETVVREFAREAGNVVQFRGLDGDDSFINRSSVASIAWGGRGNDVLQGGSSHDRLFGGAGDDSLRGDAGDQLLGGRGKNVMSHGEGAPGSGVGVKGAPSSVSVVTSNLTKGVLVIRGTELADEIRVDRTSGGYISVYNKTDRGQLVDEGTSLYQASKVTHIVIDAGNGDDKVTVTSRVTGWTRIFGGYGSDTIEGGAGVDNIYGGGGNDTLRGNGGNDFIVGGTGTDSILGGTGSNSIHHGVYSREDAHSSMESEIFRLTNLERTKRGLRALTFDKRLANAADLHAGQMAEQSALIGAAAAHSHSLWGVLLPTHMSRVDYSGFPHNSLRENIAYGYTTAAKVVNGWMNSPGHKANILSTDVTHFGVGVAIKNSRYFFAQSFARLA